MTSPHPQTTDFSRDIIGRYVCNGLDEALRSTDTSVRPDAKPFDIIVLGAGAIGGALAQHLYAQDSTHSHRILVLDAGPYLLPEHLQNMPLRGVNIYGPDPTSIAELRRQGRFGLDHPRDEVWGLSWHSNVDFPGLAYVLGGRSLGWGGWAPQWLPEEIPTTGSAPWPPAFVSDMFDRYLDEAAAELGSAETNDFIHGPLHDAVRSRLAGGIAAGEVRGAIPLADLPDPAGGSALGTEGKLEAPLAVQAKSRAGFLPLNKFSSVPLMMAATRDAATGSGFDDVKKRLMIVPNCHVIRLDTEHAGDDHVVTGIRTSQGWIPVGEDAQVVLAMGTIENNRLALLSFGNTSNAGLIGKNLGAHLISFFSFRIPREALDVDPDLHELQATALFVKGRQGYRNGETGHFSLQITGSGFGPWEFNSEAELYQTIPDIDSLERFRYADDSHVVLTIFGIGEMRAHNPECHVRLDPEVDEFGVRRAYVGLDMTGDDADLWDAMDAAADDVARVLAGDRPYEILTWTGLLPVAAGQDAGEVMPHHMRRFGLGSSHHEVGGLWMGDDPATSVTNADSRFHGVRNAYVAGPAAFSSGGGSAGPVLTGIASGRRLGDLLVPDARPYQPGAGAVALFDGMNPGAWQMAGEGGFIVVDGGLESVPGDDLGLFWFTQPMPESYELGVEWRRFGSGDNSGVFVRFPDLHLKGYDNPAYVGVHHGFEAQIDGAAPGTIYGIGQEAAVPQLPLGEWNDMTIRVTEQTYVVTLNGVETAKYHNTDVERGLMTAPTFVGLQSYPGSRVGFRNIRMTPLG